MTTDPTHVRFIFPTITACTKCGHRMTKQGSPGTGSHLRYLSCPVCGNRQTIAAIGREVRDPNNGSARLLINQ
jgi:hypothetical protein